MLSLFGGWASTITINLLRSGWRSPLHHSICWEFSHPCFTLQRIFPTSAVQTPVSLSGNHWSVGWSCCPPSLCSILDVRGSGTLEPLSIRKRRSLHHSLCIVFSVFDDDDGYKRGQTSRLVVGTEIQTNCNFEAYVYYCNYLLGFYSSRVFMWNFLWPYNLFVQLFSYIILPGNIICIVHKDFLHSQKSPSTSTRSTTGEPDKCTEHGAIKKGSRQCTVGAVSISCLFCTNIYGENCDRSY